jgi:hypothetical protein
VRRIRMSPCGPERHVASPHDCGRKQGIAEVDEQRPFAEGDARDPKRASRGRHPPTAVKISTPSANAPIIKKNGDRKFRRLGIVTSILRPFGVVKTVFNEVPASLHRIERTEGIVPPSPLGKSGALPLSYVRKKYSMAPYQLPKDWRTKIDVNLIAVHG